MDAPLSFRGAVAGASCVAAAAGGVMVLVVRFSEYQEDSSLDNEVDGDDEDGGQYQEADDGVSQYQEADDFDGYDEFVQPTLS
ncbi:hypothetical protein BVRB_9g209200 [Beta vulgaris subsp. vulgaris]|nr:hypothetical protein BVRB_9g209200 [Beta vulgaris subsp. vulgaris]